MKQIVVLLLALTMFTYCNYHVDDPYELPDNIKEINFPEGFEFSTLRPVTINLSAPEMLRQSVFNVYYKDADDKEVFLINGSFNPQNIFTLSATIPHTSDSILVRSKTFGLEKEVTFPIHNKVASYDYNINFYAARESVFPYGPAYKSAQLVSAFTYMGSYSPHGYPSYLYAVNDHAFESLLVNLFQTLPEGVSAPLTKPQYFASDKQTNLHLDESAEVYVTFAGENTDKENALGYVVYSGGDISTYTHTIIFPNCSGPGSGGSLHSGDQVYLGVFPANTTLVWFVVKDGFTSSHVVSTTAEIYYSIPSFNSETDTTVNQHMISMQDLENEVVVVGVEDDNRTTGVSDDDFNDVVFYITMNPFSALDDANVNNTYSPVDTDGDGILDSLDAFPYDVNRAFINGGDGGASASLAFEDLWPFQGDYDFNDLVVNYDFSSVTNSNNAVVSLHIDLEIVNVGGSYHNGFGIEFPFLSTLVDSVVGARITSNYISIASNGLEADRTNAIAILFDDGWEVKGDSFTVDIYLNTPLSDQEVGTFPFNPFMIIDSERGKEIHMADYPPTEGADLTLLGTGADYSRPQYNLYYRSEFNLPWVINVSGEFVYPVEKAPINNGYLKFSEWAYSSGVDFIDWYQDIPGYRNPQYLHSN